MNTILLSRGQPPRTPSLLAFSDYREAEQANGAKQSSVTANGALLEYETLELRVHPPNVNIDNDAYADRTLITLDSANRPGTLVEVVQLLTELGLCVIKARISSDGGWFVDEFSVTDAGKKVTNERKLRAIRKVLSVDTDPGSDNECSTDSEFQEASQLSTVFEIAGNDRIGLLADVIELLKNNGCEVRSAAVWTHNLRCAFVISVLDSATGHPIKDAFKLAGLQDMLLKKMRSSGDTADLVVKVANTKGLIHYERRLHQLLLREEEAQWKRLTNLAATYEQEIAEQHALLERRWAGTGLGAQSTSGTSAGPGSGPAASLQRASTGTGGRPQLQPPQLCPTSSSTLPSPGARGVSNLPPATLPSAKQGSNVASTAAAGAAANVAVAMGSPTMGSPDGSTHGGACCSGLSDVSVGPSGLTSPFSRNAAVVDASGSSNGQTSGSGACMGTSAVMSGGSGAAVIANGCGGPAESRAPSPTNALPSAATLAAPPSPSPPVAPPASSAQKPEVLVQHSKQRDYWMVSIRCRDRQKLLFDTVCTLADLNYDVYHGAVDCELDDKANISIAVQTFYMRPRYGDSLWDPRKAAKLKYMLECAIQRRQPQGTKVHIQGAPCGGAAGVGSSAPAADLPALTAVWRKFGLCITRAKVRALAGSAGEHTFYLVDNYGRPPADTVVQQACQQIGGVRLARPGSGRVAQGSNAALGAPRGEAMKFAFTVLTRPGWSANQGSPANSLPDSI